MTDRIRIMHDHDPVHPGTPPADKVWMNLGDVVRWLRDDGHAHASDRLWRAVYDERTRG